MVSDKGNDIANQFIVKLDNSTYFQSYESVIVQKSHDTGEILLDEKYWDYSNTTRKYRNAFLRMTSKEVKAAIESGRFKLVNLN